MFEFARFAVRNPSYVTKNARRTWSVRKSMKEFRAMPKNQYCWWCGRNKKLEVHHIAPVSVAPEFAGDKTNMIMLCRKPACHQIIGHDGDFGGRYVENVIEVCRLGATVKVVAQESDVRKT